MDFLELTEQEHKEAKLKYKDKNFPRYSRKVLQIGKKEGYWDNDQFILQVKKASRIASFKYLKDSHTIIWIFDQSSNHRAYSKVALIASRTKVKTGPFKWKMRSTPAVVNSRPFVQCMVNSRG